MYEKRELYM
jgi:hypothetical protein